MICTPGTARRKPAEMRLTKRAASDDVCDAVDGWCGEPAGAAETVERSAQSAVATRTTAIACRRARVMKVQQYSVVGQGRQAGLRIIRVWKAIGSGGREIRTPQPVRTAPAAGPAASGTTFPPARR